MGERSQKFKSKRKKNNLVYRRTEIDVEDKFDSSRIYYVLFVITLALLVYLLFFSKVFNVNEVKVRGLREVSDNDFKNAIGSKLNSELFKNNILFFDSDSLERELKKKYSLKTIKIKKHYPSKIEAVAEEYIIEINWLSSGKFYYIDEKGKAVGVYTQKKDNTPVVEDKKNLPVEVGKSMVTPQFINFIKYLNQNFSSINSAKITKIEINESFNEINVYSDLGFYITFDTSRDPAQELNNLNTILNSKELQGKKLTYMDLRIKNKVFYK